MLFSVLSVVAVIIAAVGVYLANLPRSKIPEHLLHHKVFVKEDLIPLPMVKEMIELMKVIREFPNNIDQNKVTGFIPVHEEIGEGQAIEADGTCKHPLLFPNIAKTRCILPQRLDVGKHFLLTGGLDGIKENYKDLMSRVSSFSKITFLEDIDKYPVVKQLFNSEEYQSAAKSVCPNYTNETVLDTFQFNFVISVPGQTVAAHLDGPYFQHASRRHFPQWLLACMVFSGLFQDEFIDQIQVVGYLHELKPHKSLGGEFVYYISNDEDTGIGRLASNTGSGTIVDGSKVIHAAKIYRPDVKAPHLDKDKDCILTYQSDDKWDILCDKESVASYATNDLRISLVYRAKCFPNQKAMDEYNNQSPSDMMPLETILGRFIKDMADNKGMKKEELEAMNRLDFAMLLMSHYLHYPLPPKSATLIPYNYCAVPLLLPWTNAFFKLICA